MKYLPTLPSVFPSTAVVLNSDTMILVAVLAAVEAKAILASQHRQPFGVHYQFPGLWSASGVLFPGG